MIRQRTRCVRRLEANRQDVEILGQVNADLVHGCAIERERAWQQSGELVRYVIKSWRRGRGLVNLVLRAVPAVRPADAQPKLPEESIAAFPQPDDRLASRNERR